mmetsp:Transcript_8685/g.12968  ORF Transcript_8685/g.12968 Transcript_8685/m.12968 type:complete len:208 (+) Transcript_8685:88-711(+)
MESKTAEHDDHYMKSEGRVMFGDPFGNRGDYSKGFFYSGRRKYLHDKSVDEHANLMEPPEDFMTLKQKRNTVLLRKGGVQLMQRLEFKKSGDSDEVSAAKLAAARKAEALSKKKVLVISTQATTKDEWIKETQAGCVFWVHKSTGITSMECPYDSDAPEDAPNEEKVSTPLSPTAEEDEFPATGSMVYNSDAFEDLISQLDSMGGKK